MYGAAEPTQFGRSRSRLRDLGLPESPKKVADPQHWYLSWNMKYGTSPVMKYNVYSVMSIR